MNDSGRILAVSPAYAIEDGEIIIECEGLRLTANSNFTCYFGDQIAEVTAASSKRIIASVPEGLTGTVDVVFENNGFRSEPYAIRLGEIVADDMHIVANPAVDPKDGSVILTRSGTRGQQLPNTLYRLESDGYIDELPVEVLNPTGVAFDQNGELYVTNRADGDVFRIEGNTDAVRFSGGLGIATGIVFDDENVMYVGDRSGTIQKVYGFGDHEVFAELEPSVSAYHLAYYGGRIFVSAPGLSSYDAIYSIDREGNVERFAKGFGRPQGLAFDVNGNLYAAACFQGRHGIIKFDSQTSTTEVVAAGNSLVGLCFDGNGNMLAATNDSLYRLPIGISGTLLN